MFVFQTNASEKEWQVVDRPREGEVKMVEVTDLSAADRKQLAGLSQAASSHETAFGVHKTDKKMEEDKTAYAVFLGSHPNKDGTQRDGKELNVRQLSGTSNGEILWRFGNGDVFSDSKIRELSTVTVGKNVPLIANAEVMSYNEQRKMNSGAPYICTIPDNNNKATTYAINSSEAGQISKINEEIAKIKTDPKTGDKKYRLSDQDEAQIAMKNAEILNIVKNKTAFACPVRPGSEIRGMGAMVHQLNPQTVNNLAQSGISLPETLKNVAKTQEAVIKPEPVKPQLAKGTN